MAEIPFSFLEHREEATAGAALKSIRPRVRDISPSSFKDGFLIKCPGTNSGILSHTTCIRSFLYHVVLDVAAVIILSPTCSRAVICGILLYAWKG